MNFKRRLFAPIGRVIYRLYKNIENDDCIGFATRIAYSTLFSVVPFLIVLITTLGFLGLSNESIYAILNIEFQNIPKPIISLIERNIDTIFLESHRKLFSIGLIFTIWGSTNVISVAFMGINKIFKGKDTRPFYKRRLVSFLFVLCIGIITGGIYVFVHTGSVILKHLEIENNIWNYLKSFEWPISIITVFLLTGAIYHLAPELKTPVLIAIPGAIFFTGFWNSITVGFTYYVGEFFDFSAVYGTLGTAVFILIWFYLAGLIFMVGGEINYLFYLKFVKKESFISKSNYNK